jgi:hypothetical protein
MPIRINLLAEAQALEDMRRRDPVKRAILGGIVLLLLMLAWSSSLQLKAMVVRSVVTRLEGQVRARTNEYQAVVENQRKLADVTYRLQSLQQLATNRLLHGTLLNAVQQATIDDVQLVRYRTEQSYQFAEEVKPKTNANNAIVPGKPATVTERIVVTLDARDSGPNPGDQVNKYKQSVTDGAYFQAMLGKTNEVRLTSLSPPQAGGADTRPFVMFTLECRYPEKTR